MDIESTVSERYSQGAREKQEALCCPVDYEPGLLEMLPGESIAKDYGCGDPSRYVHPGDVVLDPGSGGGTSCYLAAQLVGPRGRVIGVDMRSTVSAAQYVSLTAAAYADAFIDPHTQPSAAAAGCCAPALPVTDAREGGACHDGHGGCCG